jgi:AraC family transcriptional regulator
VQPADQSFRADWRRGALAPKFASQVKQATAGRRRLPVVKAETRSFYEAAVERAVTRITRTLDQALDLALLAREAALSPFHFHRVFRGMLGETPLEMHRRLRLERSASELLGSHRSVTAIAFAAGYETHEAFTRTFRQAYGAAPSAFRQSAAEARFGCARPPQTELATASGVHFHADAPDAHPVRFIPGDNVMNVTIETLPELRVAATRHIGSYVRISEAFARLGEIAGPAGLLAFPTTMMVGVFYDDPETTPAHELRSDACVTIPESAHVPEGLEEKRIPAGRYARYTQVGPYSQLPDAWARLMGQWLPRSGYRVDDRSSFEIYRNTPENTPQEGLQTDLYLPVR